MAGRLLLAATGSKDGTARLWDAGCGAKGLCLRTLAGHLDAVNTVTLSPEGSHVATGSADSTARVWTLDGGLGVCTFAEHGGEVLAAAYSPRGSRILTGGREGYGLVWSALDGRPTRPGTLRGHSAAVSAVAWAPEESGSAMLTGSLDGTARVFNCYGNEVSVLQGHEDEITAVAWAPDGSTVATASEDGCAKVWQWAEGTCLATFSGHNDSVTSVTYCPDGSRLATGSADGSARWWSLRGGCLQTIRGHDREVTCVTFSQDGAYFGTASLDATAKVWDAKSGECLATLAGHTAGVTSLALQVRDCSSREEPRGTVLAAAPKEVGNHGTAEDLAEAVAAAREAGKEYERDPSRWLQEL